jgi:hypothetical protein
MVNCRVHGQDSDATRMADVSKYCIGFVATGIGATPETSCFPSWSPHKNQIKKKKKKKYCAQTARDDNDDLDENDDWSDQEEENDDDDDDVDFDFADWHDDPEG